MFRLETDRLLLRPWEEADRAAFTRLMSDPEVTRHLNGGRPFSDDDIEGFYVRQARNLASHGVCMAGIVEKTSGAIVGLGGVQPLGTTNDLEIGWIFARDRWGRGYATELGAAAMHHILVTLARPRAVAIIAPENEPSKRVAARLGMQYEATYTGAELGHRMPEIVVDLFFKS